jgi:hypothetical protein
MCQPADGTVPVFASVLRLNTAYFVSAACVPVRFWAVAEAPTAEDPATHVYIDSLCPDVLETLVHTLLLLQVGQQTGCLIIPCPYRKKQEPSFRVNW